MARERKDVVWLAQIGDREEWLRYTGGGWGPEYVTTDNMMKAARFSSPSDVPARFRINGWWGHPVRPVRAYLTTSIRMA